MKRIKATFSDPHEADLCLMKLSPYISSSSVETTASEEYVSKPSHDCGLNAFWGVMASYQWIGGFGRETVRRTTISVDFPNKFEETVRHIIHLHGGDEYAPLHDGQR